MLADLEESDQEALGVTGMQLRSMRNLALKSDKKPFATTRVIIDGRGCLVGKGRQFSAQTFKKRLDNLLHEAGADAEQVRNAYCIFDDIALVICINI